MEINVAVGLQHEVLFTDFDYHTYQWRYESFCQSEYFQLRPPHDKFWPLTIDLKGGHVVIEIPVNLLTLRLPRVLIPTSDTKIYRPPPQVSHDSLDVEA